MKTAATAMLLAACLALPAASGAEDAPEPAAETDAGKIPEEKEQAIRKLMELTGAAQYGQQLSDNLMSQLKPAFPDVPDSEWAEVEKSLDPAEVTQRVLPIYDRHFELDEIEALIEFYSTPVGQDVLEKLPTVMRESMQTGQAWGQAHAREIVQSLAEEGYEPTRR